MEIRPIAADQKTPVDIHEWDPNAKAYVRRLSSINRETYRKLVRGYMSESLGDDERAEAGALICVMALVGEDGNELLTIDDVDRIKKADFMPINRVFDAITKQLTGEEDEAGGKKG